MNTASPLGDPTTGRWAGGRAGLTLVLGGTRSGKSELAERILSTEGAAHTYVATAPPADGDTEMAARIAAHRERRAKSSVEWTTTQLSSADELPNLLREIKGPVLVDSLGSWVSSSPELDIDLTEFCNVLGERREQQLPTVVVSEEVGLSVHPRTAVGRRFVDVLGDVNRAVAELADRVLLVVAGRVLPLEPWR